jgi:hypothetical protein
MRWDETKKQRIRRQLIRKVTPFMKDIIILRTGQNVFGEHEEDQYVCKTKGYYHPSRNVFIRDDVNDAGRFLKFCEDKVLFIVDDDVRKIEKGDYFTLDGTQYEILDLGNIEDIIYDTFLKRKE